MNKLLNPRWIFIINTVPTVMLAILFYSEFRIIKSLLTPMNISYWKWFSLAVFALGFMNMVYAFLSINLKGNISIYYGAITLLLYIPFLYLFGLFSDEIIPRSIPRWMIPENMIFYSGTFLMPTLVYALLIITIHTSSDRNAPWKNFLFAMLIPTVWYIFLQVVLPFWQPLGSDFGFHALLILIVAATVIFLFFLLRGIVILGKKKGGFYKQNKLIWLIPFTIIFPLLGLGINNGLLWNEFGGSFDGIFGDFSNYWFYILAGINGVLLCLPDLTKERYRLILFTGRSITFIYTLYFFLVFLPFLPLSILAIIAAGTGFLMLTPIVLFIVHFQQLSSDIKYLSNYLNKKITITILLVGLLVIPCFIAANQYYDKYVLKQTLAYLYSPDYSKEYVLDKKSLKKSVQTIKKHKERSGGIVGNGTPVISLFYNWLVLDNLTLSDSKINHIENVFFGESEVKKRTIEQNEKLVEISNIESTSQYDANENYWVSWVDLELTNKSLERWGVEYETTFTLPTGCWVSDYYLYVGDKKEPGMLTEKKSALWIYTNIRNENRDPGILYYLTGNKVAFKIFPFLKDETRKSGIEFIHKESVTLKIDGHTIVLGDPEKESSNAFFENKDVAYIPVETKASLKKVKRNPYLHFILDVSKGNESSKPDYQKRINKFISNNKFTTDDAKVSFTNSIVNTISLKDWEHQIEKQERSGGFFLERAFQKILTDNYNRNDSSYPIMIVITDSLQGAILPKNFSDLQFTFPENEFYYSLNNNGGLVKHSLLKELLKPVENETTFNAEVLEYRYGNNQVAYLPDNTEPSLILKNQNIDINDLKSIEKNWRSAAYIQGLWMSHQLHPEIADEEWGNFVEMSFSSKILTPVTSYIVVENEAQRKALLRKQEQVLSGEKALDTSEDAQSMSEPSHILVLTLLAILIVWKERRKTLARTRIRP